MILEENDLLLRAGVALSAGLLIGLEREWADREVGEAEGVAGIRTFALIALLGAAWALLLESSETVLLGFAFMGFAVVLAAVQVLRALHLSDYGITTTIAALLTFVLGAAAIRGHSVFVAAAAVLTATLLGVKPVLHGWIRKLARQDLYAVFQMLLISVVLLPILPDRGFGPWGAFNPYEIWWMVVLIAGVSFSGYFAMKIVGRERGVAVTGLLGGLVSSTAVTLGFSRMGRSEPQLSRVLAAGILVACATMYPRTLFLAGVLNPSLIPLLAAPLGTMTSICFAGAAFFWKAGGRDSAFNGDELRNPFEIWTALKFGTLLAVVMLLVRALREWFGDKGVYAVALLSGITDVDTVTLSMSRLAAEDLAANVAAGAIVTAVIANTAFKIVLAAVIAGRGMGWRIGLTMSLAALSGVGVTLL